MAKRKNGKLVLTHAEQALSKVMGDLIQLPRKGAPRELSLDTVNDIRIRHVNALDSHTIWRAILDLSTRWRPVLYINAEYQRRKRWPIQDMLKVCDEFIRRGGRPETLWKAGDNRYWTSCPVCSMRCDTEADGWSMLMMEHIIKCWSGLRIRVAPYRDKYDFETHNNYAI